jgi:transposase
MADCLCMQRQVHLYLLTHGQQIPGSKSATATLTVAGLALFAQVALIQPHLFDELMEIGKWLVYYDEHLETIGQTHPECQCLPTTPGIGLLTATAVVAAVSDAEQFKNSRQFAALLPV